MSGRKRLDREDFDSQEEFDDAVRDVALSRRKKNVVATQGSGENNVPEPVVFTHTVLQWMRQWEMADTAEAEVFYTIGDIRTLLFGLVPFGNVADPLEKIKDMLEGGGFFPVSNAAFSTPVYQLKKREKEMVLTSDGEIKRVDDGLSLF